MTIRLTLDIPDDDPTPTPTPTPVGPVDRPTREFPAAQVDEARVNAAVLDYLSAAAAGPVDDADWLNEQPEELRPKLEEFLSQRAALAAVWSPPVSPVPLALPDTPRYTHLRLVGKGGMGAVYRAKDAVLERAVAVKVIHPALARNPSDAERFLREARVIARLQHRNIVPIYDYGLLPGPNGRPYFTMQLIEGEGGDDRRGATLLDVLKGYHAAPTAAGFQALVTAVGGVCDAVAHAHAVDVLHRDLKPANVLMTGDRDVLVVDWGLSKVLTVDARRTTALGGTPEYLPPEVASGADVGKPADVFGLGGILAAVLTGRPVYVRTEEDSAIELAARSDTRGCLRRLAGSGQPPELVRLAERCLSVDPAHRPTAGEVAAAVVGHLASVEERARGAEIEAVKALERETQGRRRRRLQALLAVAAAALVAVVAGFVIWFTLDRAERRRQDDLADQARQTDARDRDERVREAVAAGVAAAGDGRLTAAAAALERATGALGPQPPDDLRELVADAERVVRLAVELDDIRQELAVRRSDPQLPDGGVAKRYAAAFASAGIDPTAEDAAGRISASPLKALLVAALDDWASSRSSADPDAGVPVPRLLELARAVDPDPDWRDQFRDPSVRADPKKFAALAARAPADQLTVAQTTALVFALPLTDPNIPRLLAAAEARRPNDFGLTLVGAGWRLQALRVGVSSPADVQDALAYARTAAALRPDSLAALLALSELYDLFNHPAGLEAVAARVAALGRDTWMADTVAALAARKRGQYKEALALLKKASAAAGDPSFLRLQVAAMHLTMAEHAAALAVIDEVLKLNPKATVPRGMRAMLLVMTGKVADAERESRALLADAPANEWGRAALAVAVLVQGRLTTAEKLARTLPATNASSLGLELFGCYALIARGDSAALLAAVERADQGERYAHLAFFRYLALVGAGRFQDGKATLDAAERREKGGVPPVAWAVNMSGFTVAAMRSSLGNVAATEDKIESQADQGTLNRDRFVNTKGAERLAFGHIADVLLTKRWAWAAALAYREYLSPDTLFSGMMAGQPSQLLVAGTYRFHGIRAMAQASVGGGRDGFRTTDKDRAECRADALRWLKEEVDACKRFAAGKPSGFSFGKLWDGGTPAVANFRLHLLKWHADLEPIRNKTVIAEMPEADRKLAEKTWAEVDKLYATLNPPLNLPGMKDP